MGSTDFRGGYGFDSGIYGGQRTGGLLGMLQEYLEQQQRQPGAGFSSAPNWTDSYCSPQGGGLGQLFALPAEQNSHPPSARNDGSALGGSRNPDFRQVSRARIAGGPHDAAGSGVPADHLMQRGGAASQAWAPNAGASANVVVAMNSKGRRSRSGSNADPGNRKFLLQHQIVAVRSLLRRSWLTLFLICSIRN
jgi:hypothetical protein